MIDFSRYIRLTVGLSFILLAFSSACWLLSPRYQPYLAGFVLGTLISILNGLILADKTVKTADYALGKRARRQGTGTLQRFLLAGFAGYTAMKYPAYFHWLGVIVGLCTVTTLSFAIALLYHLRAKWLGKG